MTATGVTRVLVADLPGGSDPIANLARAAAVVAGPWANGLHRIGPSPSDGSPASDGPPAPSAEDDAPDLVVLPEYTSRYHHRGVDIRHAEPLDGPFVTALRESARAASSAVIVGTTIPSERGDRAVNAVVAITREGDVAGVYRKVHLYDAFGQRESDRLEPGPADAAPLVLPVGDLTVGVMTCYDLRFPEVARRLVDAGADVLVVPAAWAAGEHKADHWLTLLRARAIENTAYVIGSALQGRGLTGDSCIVDPTGVVLARTGPAAAEARQRASVVDAGEEAGGSPRWVAANLDASVVAAVRERNPSLANRRYRVVPLVD